MKLHTFPRGPNPRRVHIYLSEKRLSVPCETVDILKRDNRKPDFLARNAVGGVPVLELDDGSHLAESVAICRYFEALHPEPPLFGTTPQEQGRVEMWIRRAELEVMVPTGLVWAHGSPLTRSVFPDQLPEMAAQSRKRVARGHELLDQQLAREPFLAGDTFSMADIVAFCTVDFGAALVELPLDPAHEQLARWHAEVSERPSVRD